MITEESTVQQQNELQYIYNVTDYILFALHMKTPL